MQEAFMPDVIGGRSCNGQKPWTAIRSEPCGHAVRVLQRGASNLYFPIIRSSLLIPPWDDEIEGILGEWWPELEETIEEERRIRLRRWIERGTLSVPRHINTDTFVDYVLAHLERRTSIAESDLRAGEWQQIMNPLGKGSSEFQVRMELVPSSLSQRIGSLTRVVRLRELRALIGFTRISSPPSEEEEQSPSACSVVDEKPTWYPATEVRGEGIYVGLDDTALREWENREDVLVRCERIHSAWVSEFRQRMLTDAEPKRTITPRFLLTHALSHALMRQLSLECGYSSSSLRERLYVGTYGAGFLIYTATSDADGTLGGLERLGRSHRFERTLGEAIHSLRWCSSDPLCIEGAMMASNACNNAACHACLLASETSCEEYNRFLDRALLVGMPGNPAIGYFSDQAGAAT
jgi:hypothetical protein